jgi:hypothetical protein
MFLLHVGMPKQQFVTEAEPGILVALTRLTGVQSEFIPRQYLRGPAAGDVTSTGRKLQQSSKLSAHGTIVAYYIYVPRSQGPALKARMADAMKDNAAGLYTALKAAGISITPMAYLNAGAAVGDPNLLPAPSSAAAQPSPNPAAPAPVPTVPLGLILGTVLACVVVCLLVSWYVVPSICARLNTRSQIHPEAPAPGKASIVDKQVPAVKVVGA